MDPRAPPIPSLSDLSRARPTPEEVNVFDEHLDGQPARVVVISYAALVEAILEDALMVHMVILDTARFKEVFRDAEAPLSTFSAKITLAHAVGIIGDEMRSQMDQLRRLRNAFAHAVKPIDFDHPTISAACLKLDARRMLKDIEITDYKDEPGERVKAASMLMGLHVLQYTQFVTDEIKAGRRSKPTTFRSTFA